MVDLDSCAGLAFLSRPPVALSPVPSTVGAGAVPLPSGAMRLRYA